MKQMRIAIIHNGTPQSEDYANALDERLTDETVIVNVQDPRPIRLALPVRAVPNVAIMIFADSLEEQGMVEVLDEIAFFKSHSNAKADSGDGQLQA